MTTLSISDHDQITNQSAQGVASQRIEAALRQHWAASAAGNQNVEHAIYDEHVICDYPQSGERIHGKQNLQTLRSASSGQIRRASGFGGFSAPANCGLRNTRSPIRASRFSTISIMEFENAKVVRETQYFAEPFDPPAWRAQWVEQVGTDQRA